MPVTPFHNYIPRMGTGSCLTVSTAHDADIKTQRFMVHNLNLKMSKPAPSILHS